MSIREINHYALKSPCSIFDEEALTALQLAARTAGKVNECVSEFNRLEENTVENLEAQDAELKNMKEVQIPAEIASEILKYINSDHFINEIDKYAGNLTQRLENLFGSLAEGSTVLDAELIDVRTGPDGKIYNSAGEAVRSQFNKIPRLGIFHPYRDGCVNIDTNAKTVSTSHASFIMYGSERYTLNAFSASYVDISQNVFLVAYDTKDNAVKCVTTASYNRNSMIGMFYVNLAANTINSYCIAPYIGEYTINGKKIESMHDPVARMGINVIEPYSVAFDTHNETVTIGSHIYVWCGSHEYHVEPQTISFADTGDNTNYLVINPDTLAISIVPTTEYDGRSIIVFSFQTNRFTVPEFQSIDNYIVDGVGYSRIRAASVSGGSVAYVNGQSGLDTNTGEAGSPFRSIQRAINSGATIIKVKSGTYFEAISAQDLDELTIVADWSEYDESTPDRPKVIIKGSSTITAMKVTGTNVRQCEFGATDTIRSVFIDRTLPLEVNDGGRSKAYNVTLISSAGTLLKPLATYAEVEANANSFTYNNGFFFINYSGADSDFELIAGQTAENKITNVKKVVLEDIVFTGNRKNNLALKNVNNASVKNCEFINSGIANGVSIINSNVDFTNCKATNNRNDGFNLHGYGSSNFNNCEGCNNRDDGISHHDGCIGVINGGVYNNNAKAGIAPTYGAQVNCYNVVTDNNNQYDYLYSADNNDTARTCYIFGGYISNSYTGVHANRYNVVVVNCYFEPTAFFQESETLNGGTIIRKG